MGFFTRFKYTELIEKANKEFIDAYNFEIPPEERTVDSINILAYRVFYENLRMNKTLSIDIASILDVLYTINNNLAKRIKWSAIPHSLQAVMYQNYINSRARKLDVETSMYYAFTEYLSLANSINEKQLSDDYEKQQAIESKTLTDKDKALLVANGYTFLSGTIVRKDGTWNDYKINKKNFQITLAGQNETIDFTKIVKNK